MPSFQFFQECASISEETPLYESVGSNNIPATTSLAQGKALVDDFDTPKSMSSVETLAGIYAANSAADFQQQVIDYIIEWTKTVTTKVDAELEAFDRFEEILYHYEIKVAGLRNKSKRKENVRLARNEKKLKDAGERRNDQLEKACSLLKAITENSWKDLYPLVEQTMNWETNRLDGEIDTYGMLLPKTLEDMRGGMIAGKCTSQQLVHKPVRVELSKQTRENLKLEYRINNLEEILRGEWSTREEITLKLKGTLDFTMKERKSAE
jgi:hypothetical protein